ncbi:MAG: DUF1501 domain-containing protein [Fuerstiella sp.]|nr:DUF1501 domain-containing protein [Fuerstiella sp.]
MEYKISRRQALKATTNGFAWLAFSALADRQARAENGLAPKSPHFPARAKRVIMLTMPGGPSHVDTFDYKPQLIKDNDKQGKYGNHRGASLLASPWKFSQHGRSGLWISELFPNVASLADDLCLLRGMQTDIPDHARAQLQMHTGNFQFPRPSLGVWSLYGLGSESENLPGYVAMGGGKGSKQILSSSFLPGVYQGTAIDMPKGAQGSRKGGRRKRGADDTQGVVNIRNPRLSPSLQRIQLDYVQSLNREKLKRETRQPGVDGIVESFELAFRMQDSLPEVMGQAGESQETLNLYGIGNSDTDEFGRKCLLARRFAEAGVRIIELGHSGAWDTHGDLRNKLAESCRQTDLPIAGLLKDLKRRDMLKDTLVIWAGEFGRTPHGQGGNGRDHNAKGYATWMAGGGVKGGFSYGSTDEHGYEAVEDKTHINDWHATILYLLGLNHEQLTYRYAGRDFRLTNVAGKVANQIIS